jgi:hypothetical protein
VKQVQFRCVAFSRHCTEFDYRELPHNRRLPLIKYLRDVTVEELGEADISGLQAVGQRTIRIIPEGSNGNDRPLNTIEEVWHSRELDVDVQVKRSDSRFGVRATTLTDVNLGEPDPSFFQIPEGYTVGPPRRSSGAIAPLPESGMPAIPPPAPSLL